MMSEVFNHLFPRLLVTCAAFVLAHRLMRAVRERCDVADQENAPGGQMSDADRVTESLEPGPRPGLIDPSPFAGWWPTAVGLLVLAGLIRQPFLLTLDWYARPPSWLGGVGFTLRPSPVSALAWLLPTLTVYLAVQSIAAALPASVRRSQSQSKIETFAALALAGAWLSLAGHLLNAALQWQASVEARSRSYGAPSADFVTMSLDLVLQGWALGIGFWACYRTATWLRHGRKSWFRLGWRRRGGWLMGLAAWGMVADGFLALTRPLLAAALRLPPIMEWMQGAGDLADVGLMAQGSGLVFRLAAAFVLAVLGSLARPVLDRAMAVANDPLPDPLDIRLLKEVAAVGLLAWTLTGLLPYLHGLYQWARYGYWAG